MIEDSKVRSAAERAEKVVSNVGEPYRKEAFGVLFRLFLTEDGLGSVELRGVPQAPRLKKEGQGKAGNSINEILATQLDFSEFADQIESGSWVEKAMVVLWVVERKLGIDALSPGELGTIMERQLRLPYVYSSNVNRDLRGARDLFLRTRHGRGYKYSLSAKGRAKFGRA